MHLLSVMDPSRIASPLASWGPWRWVATLVALVIAVPLVWSVVEARTLHITHDVVTSPNLPQAFDGTRLVFVADVHAGPYFGKGRMSNLVERVNALEPDILVFGGDYVGGRANGKSVFYPAVEGFTSRLGAVAVLGNHDTWEGKAEAIKGLEDAGIVVLENDHARVRGGGDSIVIAGIEDIQTGNPDAEAAAEDIARDGFAVLVAHNPDAFATALPATKGAFDLALAAHTHAGQLTAFGAMAPIVPSRFGQRYREGWLEEAGVPVLVSRGIGTVTLPMRFFARPEVNVIELRRGPARITRR